MTWGKGNALSFVSFVKFTRTFHHSPATFVLSVQCLHSWWGWKSDGRWRLKPLGTWPPSKQQQKAWKTFTGQHSCTDKHPFDLTPSPFWYGTLSQVATKADVATNVMLGKYRSIAAVTSARTELLLSSLQEIVPPRRLSSWVQRGAMMSLPEFRRGM